MSTSPTYDEASLVLGAQPFSRLLGARLSRFDEGRATLEVSLLPEHRQQDGFAHGGVVAYSADNAMTFAGGSVLGARVLTASMTIDYLAPARGDVLRAEAEVRHRSDRQAICDCTVSTRIDGEWAVCAVARGRIRTTSPSPSS